VLVTVLLIAVAALAMHAMPSAVLAGRLVGLMLPMQFTIGVVNDLADVADDSVTKPYKPLVRGAVPRGVPLTLSVVFVAISLACAATFGWIVVLFTLAGFASGPSYDLGLRRTVLSLLPWWGGMLVVPLLGFAVAGRLDGRLWPIVPLTFLIALSLHCANTYPDISGDRVTGKHGLPAVLGRRESFVVMLLAAMAAAVLAMTVFRPASAGGGLFAAGALAVGAALLVALSRPSRPFPALALVTALLAVAWLAGVAFD
jgi:4-hydroxybenzoate polyprenyltransferase